MKKIILLLTGIFFSWSILGQTTNFSTDSDGDGVVDQIDPCPNDPTSIIGNLSFESDFMGWTIPQNSQNFSISENPENTLEGDKSLLVTAPNSSAFEGYTITSNEFILEPGVSYNFKIPVKKTSDVEGDAIRWVLIDENGIYRHFNNHYNIETDWTNISYTNFQVNFDYYSSQVFRLQLEFGLSTTDIVVDKIEFYKSELGSDPAYTDKDGDGNPDCGNIVSTCPTGNITLTTQADVDAFVAQYPDCTEIQGDLCLGDCDGQWWDNPSNISDISGLNNFQKVQGRITLANLDNLSDFNGLSGLNEIVGHIAILGNQQLKDFTFLQNLSGDMGGGLSLYWNDNLENLEGLSNITSFTREIWIDNNPNLTSLDGLENTKQAAYIILQSNTSLLNVDGLSGFEKLSDSGISINNNPALQNLDGLSNLTELNGRLNIIRNISLTDIKGLSSIDPATIKNQYSGSDIWIAYNTSLTNCSIENICLVLNTNDDRVVEIYANGTGCNSIEEVKQNCGPTERETLVKFYQATNGDNWLNNTNWLTNLEINSWYGVSTYPNNKITYLGLDNNNLSGTLPEEIGDLDPLEILYLDRNSIGGILPSSMGQLVNLRLLALGENQFTGEVPSSFSSLSSLEVLQLSDNQLEGLIPDLTNLEALRLLHIQNNNFIFSNFEDQFTALDQNIEDFQYAPQNNFDEPVMVNLLTGQSFTLTSLFANLESASPNNNYQWYKDEVPIAGATSPTYTIQKFNKNLAGIYILKVTNDVVYNLTLERNPYTINLAGNSPKDAQFSIVPNPASDIITLNSDSILLEGATIIIRDMKGGVILSTSFENDFEINISSLRSGIYFLSITTSEGIYTERLIKR